MRGFDDVFYVPHSRYNDPTGEPVVRWRGHANLLFMNWLNHFVYQETPYDLKEIR